MLLDLAVVYLVGAPIAICLALAIYLFVNDASRHGGTVESGRGRQPHRRRPAH